MKRIALIIFVVSIALFVAFPNDVQAQGAQGGLNYIVIKGGAYFPTGDLEDTVFGEFDTDFAGEVAIGHYFTRDYVISPAIEIGVGYYSTNVDSIFIVPQTGFVVVSGDGYAIPVRVTFKAAVNGQFGEYYTGVGFGVYFVNFDVSGTYQDVSVSLEDDAAVFGGHVMAGFNFNITPNAFVGFEGQYIFTDDVEIFEPYLTGGNINGWVATATLGYRF